jgi:hypothetical protein
MSLSLAFSLFCFLDSFLLSLTPFFRLSFITRAFLFRFPYPDGIKVDASKPEATLECTSRFRSSTRTTFFIHSSITFVCSPSAHRCSRSLLCSSTDGILSTDLPIKDWAGTSFSAPTSARSSARASALFTYSLALVGHASALFDHASTLFAHTSAPSPTPMFS